jgi:hypothetical protein
LKWQETGLNTKCDKIRGLSGEYGCYQHLIPTYREQSIKVLGYVAPMTKDNVEYVTVKTVDLMLKNQMTVEDVAKKWNQGHTGKCSVGINSLGIKFNSCQYVKELLDKYNKLK